MKPYLYGGIVLLIVGLFSYASITRAQLTTRGLQLQAAQETNLTLAGEIASLREQDARKAGAAEAYIAATEKLAGLSTKVQGIISNYKPRDTEDEKCLDMRPPTELIRMLREDSLQGQGDMHSSQ